MKTIIQFLSASLLVVPAFVCAAEIQQGEMAGYLFGPAEKVPEEFNGGFSLYAAAWPLVETYPGHRFQTGLCGTWMHPQYEPDKKPAGECYTDLSTSAVGRVYACIAPTSFPVSPEGHSTVRHRIATRQELAGAASRPHDQGKARQ